jgi:hypothetical protein
MASRGDTIDKALALKSDVDVVERLRAKMPDSLAMLDRIASGDVPRNAQSILKAIETQLRFSQPLPKTTIEHQGAVGLQVIDPYAEPPDDSIDGEVIKTLSLPAPAAPEARAPIRRRKAALPCEEGPKE